MENQVTLVQNTVVLTPDGSTEQREVVAIEVPYTVALNDEEIGVTPVTVNFNWYGDYNIRIEKPGYDILNTHQLLERPAHDVFPLDFFAEVLWLGTIEDSYTWTFQLEPFQQASAAELIEQANQMRDQANNELGKIAVEILAEEQK